MYDFIVMAIPNKGSKATSFSFDFKMVGTKYEWYELFFAHIENSENPMMFAIIYFVGISCILMCCGVAIGCKCAKKKEGAVVAPTALLNDTNPT